MIRPLLVAFLVLVVNGVLFRLEYAGYLGARRQLALAAMQPASPGDATAPLCGKAPAAGTSVVLNPDFGRYDNVLSTITIRNTRADMVVAVLGDDQLLNPGRLVVVAPGAQASLRVGALHYGLALLAGHSWCSLSSGFVDGQHLVQAGGVTVKPDGQTELSVGQDDAGAIVAEYRFEPTVAHDTPVLDIARSPSGMVSAGSVNGLPVSFLVDTQASAVSLPPAIAAAAGVRCARQTKYLVASGTVPGCVALAKELRFGPFRLNDIEVAVIPGGEQPVLGMSALRMFVLARTGPGLRITPLEGVKGEVDGTLPDMVFAPIVPWSEPKAIPTVTEEEVSAAGRAAKILFAGAAFTLLVHAAIVIWMVRAGARWLMAQIEDTGFGT